jgi:amino acid permease
MATVDYKKNMSTQRTVFIALVALFVGLGIWISKKYQGKILTRFVFIALASLGVAALVMRKVIPCKPRATANRSSDTAAVQEPTAPAVTPGADAPATPAAEASPMA